MEKTKMVIYRETYEGTYEVDPSLSDEDAMEQVQEEIREGRRQGPETCVDSGAYVHPDLEDLPEGQTVYYVPFAYERYGHLPVIVPKDISRAELFEKAEEVLEKMTTTQMDSYSDYLSDSEEIDREGNIKDKDGKIQYNIGYAE